MKRILSVLFVLLMIVQIGASAFADVSITINNTTGGTATHNYVDGAESVSFKATPSTGYQFYMWAYTVNGTGASPTAANPLILPVSDGMSITVTPQYVREKYTISATAGIGGTVTGGGQYEAGQAYVLTALPNVGYDFVNWTEGGSEVIGSPGPSFYGIADGNHNYVANFKGQPHSITATVEPAGTGLVNGSDGYTEGFIYEMGKTVTVTASPKEGYVFSGWYESGMLISSSSIYSIDINRDRSLVAKFTSSATTITPPSSGSTGTTTPISIFPEPTSKIVITYMPDSYSTPATSFQKDWYAGNVFIAGQAYSRAGYTQTGWTKNGTSKDYALNASAYLTENLVLYPYWESVSVPLYLTTSIGPGGYVKLYGGGNVPNGWSGILQPKQSYTFYFYPNPGNYVYRIGFAGWHYPVQSGNSFTVTYEMMQGKNQTLQILFADARSHPPTGDESQPALYAALAIASLAGFITLAVIRRKREREEEKED